MDLYDLSLTVGETGRSEYISEEPARCACCNQICGEPGLFSKRGVTILGNEGTSLALCFECVPTLGQAVGYTVGIEDHRDWKREEKTYRTMALMFWKGVATARHQILFDRDADEKELESRLDEATNHNIALKRHIQFLDKEAERQDGEGFVYLMKRDDGCHKIGLSGNPDRRLKQIQRDFPTAVLIHTLKTDDMRQAESYMHQEFAAHRKDGEWFDLSPDQVQTICQRVRFEDGWFLTRHEGVR